MSLKQLSNVFLAAAVLASCAGSKPDVATAAPPATAVSSSTSSPSSSSAPSPPVRYNLAEVPWTDAPPSLPAGAKIAVLEGDPRKPAFFTMRLKLQPGTKLGPHTHPADERVTVLSGSIHVAFGDKFDTTRGKTFSAGAFYVNPTPMPHFVWTDEECVIQVTGIGPWGVSYLDPADAPRPRAP